MENILTVSLLSIKLCWTDTLGHIGVFLTEFSRKAIISQYCYSSLAAVNQDNYLNIILGTYDPFRILQHLFFIQSDILEIRTEKSFQLVVS